MLGTLFHVAVKSVVLHLSDSGLDGPNVFDGLIDLFDGPRSDLCSDELARGDSTDHGKRPLDEGGSLIGTEAEEVRDVQADSSGNDEFNGSCEERVHGVTFRFGDYWFIIVHVFSANIEGHLISWEVV